MCCACLPAVIRGREAGRVLISLDGPVDPSMDGIAEGGMRVLAWHHCGPPQALLVQLLGATHGGTGVRGQGRCSVWPGGDKRPCSNPSRLPLGSEHRRAATTGDTATAVMRHAPPHLRVPHIPNSPTRTGAVVTWLAGNHDDGPGGQSSRAAMQVHAAIVGGSATPR